VYESRELLNQYLLFHYGSHEEIGAFTAVPANGYDYPIRCAELFDRSLLGPNSRVLDLGCAVGRSTFELSAHAGSVIGVDLSQSFIRAAETIRAEGMAPYERTEEGEIVTALVAKRPIAARTECVRFEAGDAAGYPAGSGFDGVLLANLLDRMAKPLDMLQRLPDLVKPGGQLVITSPFTWLAEFTPKENWLGGKNNIGTADEIIRLLDGPFSLHHRADLPFLIREHSRKYQFSVAHGLVFRRR
jgi:putative 4-mercaptohistidine N1-methyltranferase